MPHPKLLLIMLLSLQATALGAVPFSAPVNVAVEDQPYSITAVDLDGDNDYDLAVANAGSNSVSLLKNDCDAVFTLETTITVGTTPRYIISFDAEGDGDMDLAVANYGSDNVTIIYNLGLWQFTKVVIGSVGDGPNCLFAANLGGDNLPDLAVTNYLTDTVRVLQNFGTYFGGWFKCAAGGSQTGVIARDFDGDGDNDLAVTSEDLRGVSFLKNTGDFAFTSWMTKQLSVNMVPQSLVSVDKDCTMPRDEDIAVSLLGTGVDPDTIRAILYDSPGTFTVDGGCAAGTSPRQIISASLTGGGSGSELIVANSGSNNITIWLNICEIVPTTQAVAVGTTPRGVCAADFDGDGDIDLATANSGSDNVSILFNESVQNLAHISFRPNPQGWQFCNCGWNMWPVEATSQINYCDGSYKPKRLFCGLDNDRFPSWDLWVRAFGEEQCYGFPWGGGHKIANPAAVFSWRARAGDWPGSCFGFAVSSLSEYDELWEVSDSFAGFSTLYSVPIMGDSRDLVNTYMARQYSAKTLVFNHEMKSTAAYQALPDIIAMLSGPCPINRFIELWNNNGRGGHSVVPYKCEIDPLNPNLTRVYVYDSNAPNQDNLFIEFNTSLNNWFYSLVPNWGGYFGLHLSEPVQDFMTYPPLSKSPSSGDELSARSVFLPDSGIVEVYGLAQASSFMLTSSLGQIGHSDDSSYVNTVANGDFLEVTAGSETPPLGAAIPEANWTARVQGYNDGENLHLSLFQSDRIITYDRIPAVSAEVESLVLNTPAHSMTIFNPNAYPISFTTTAVFPYVENEITVELDNLDCAPSAQAEIRTEQMPNVDYRNYGGAADYDLWMYWVAESLYVEFKHVAVSIPTNTMHRVVPTIAETLMVLVDNGMTGVFDDTLYLANDPSFVCGDASGDAAVDISDAVYLIAYIFGGGPAPDPLLSGDANCDDTVDISDAVYLIAFIFAGGPAPCEGCK